MLGVSAFSGQDHDYIAGRAILRTHGLIARLRSRGEEARAKQKQPGQKARRWVVERTHSGFKRLRSIRTRGCKKGAKLPGQTLLRLRPVRLPCRRMIRRGT